MTVDRQAIIPGATVRVPAGASLTRTHTYDLVLDRVDWSGDPALVHIGGKARRRNGAPSRHSHGGGKADCVIWADLVLIAPAPAPRC